MKIKDEWREAFIEASSSGWRTTDEEVYRVLNAIAPLIAAEAIEKCAMVADDEAAAWDSDAEWELGAKSAAESIASDIRCYVPRRLNDAD